MDDHQVGFLDTGGVVRGDPNAEIAESREAPGGGPGKADRGGSLFLGQLDGPDDVLGFSAGREGRHQVPGLDEGIHLAGKGAFIPVVIGDGGHQDLVGGKGEGREPLALDAETAYQFGNEVVGVSGAPPVAEGIDGLVVSVGLNDGPHHLFDLRELLGDQALLHRDALAQQAADLGVKRDSAARPDAGRRCRAWRRRWPRPCWPEPLPISGRRRPTKPGPGLRSHCRRLPRDPPGAPDRREGCGVGPKREDRHPLASPGDQNIRAQPLGDPLARPLQAAVGLPNWAAAAAISLALKV